MDTGLEAGPEKFSSLLPFPILCDAVSEGVLVLDNTGTILHSNSAALKALNLQNEYIQGMKDFELPVSWLNEDLTPTTIGEILRPKNLGQHKKILGLRTDDGSINWLRICSVRLNSLQGPVSCVTLVDITSFKKTQRKTEILQVELQKRILPSPYSELATRTSELHR